MKSISRTQGRTIIENGDKMSKKELRRAGIYAIINQLGVYKYVGQSHCILKRWRRHRWSLRRNIHDNPLLQCAWNSHGEANFRFVVIEFCQIGELDEREQYWIDKLNPECNIVRNLSEWRTYFTPVVEDGYRKDGESFTRPKWHLWVYGGHKKPG